MTNLSVTYNHVGQRAEECTEYCHGIPYILLALIFKPDSLEFQGAMTFGAPGTDGARVHDIKDVEAILDVFRSHGHTEVIVDCFDFEAILIIVHLLYAVDRHRPRVLRWDQRRVLGKDRPSLQGPEARDKALSHQGEYFHCFARWSRSYNYQRANNPITHDAEVCGISSAVYMYRVLIPKTSRGFESI